MARPGSRASEERRVTTRPSIDRWSPPSMLEVPDLGPEWRCRWVAEYVNGHSVSTNLMRKRREGYQPVRAEDLPDDFIHDGSDDGLVRTGGLVLHKIPAVIAEQRRAYYDAESKKQIGSADELQGVETPGRQRKIVSTGLMDRGSRVIADRERQDPFLEES